MLFDNTLVLMQGFGNTLIANWIFSCVGWVGYLDILGLWGHCLKYYGWIVKCVLAKPTYLCQYS